MTVQRCICQHRGLLVVTVESVTCHGKIVREGLIKLSTDQFWTGLTYIPLLFLDWRSYMQPRQMPPV